MTGQERTNRIRQIVLDWLRSETDAPVESLYTDHADLMPELSLEYEKMLQIRQARQMAPTVIAEQSTRSIAPSEADDGQPTHQLPSDVEIPDYELVRRIGQGGFGVVWLARHRLHGEFRAVKIVHHQQAIELEGVRAYILQAQQHPALVAIEHLGTVDDAYYYVMPLADDVKGQVALRSADLYEAQTVQWCVENLAPLSAEEIKRIAGDVLDGLEHLHRSGLSHCDVKPGNILQFDKRWKLADPGLLARNDQSQASRGTVAFWPPEGPQGAAADLFALGRTLYLLVGSGDFTGFEEYLTGRVELAGKQERQVQAVIAQACSADPGQRFATAADMRDALHQNVKRPRRRWSRAARSTAPAGEPKAEPVQGRPQRTTVRRAIVVSSVILCLLLLLWVRKSPYSPRLFSGAVSVDWFQVAVLRGNDRLAINQGPVGIQNGDQLQIELQLEQARHCVLLTLLPDGRVDQHWPEPGSEKRPTQRVLRSVPIPHLPLPSDRSLLFGVVVLQVSHPMPATHWTRATTQWEWKPITSDMVWLYDGGRRVAEISTAGNRWPADLGPTPPPELTQTLLALRKQSPVTDLQAVLFPVTPVTEVVNADQVDR